MTCQVCHVQGQGVKFSLSEVSSLLRPSLSLAFASWGRFPGSFSTLG